jgi:hypothetical protein
MATTPKPVSLHLMKFKDAVAVLLKVKLEPLKPKKKQAVYLL